MTDRLDSLTTFLAGLVRRRPAKEDFWFDCGSILSPQDAESLYTGYDLAARICDLFPDEALPEPWKYDTKDDLDVGMELSERVKDLNAVAILKDAAVWGRVHGDCFVYVATKDGTTNEKLPIGKVSEVRFLRKIERPWLSVATRYSDPREVDFGWPRTYFVGAPNGGPQAEIHESRFLKFYGARTSDSQRQALNGFHLSSLQAVSHTLRDFGVGWANAGQLLAQSVQPKYTIPGLNRILEAPGGAEALSRRFAQIDSVRSIIKSLILGDGETFTYEVAPLGSLPELLDRFAARLSAGSGGIPVTKLFGTSAIGMNATGEGDAKNWTRTLEAWRLDRFEPPVRKLTDMLLSERGTLDVEYCIEWPELDRLTDLETAQLRQAVASTDSTYITSQVLSPEEVALSRFRPEGWSMETELIEGPRPGQEQDSAAGAPADAPNADAPNADAPNADAPNADAPNADAPNAGGGAEHTDGGDLADLEALAKKMLEIVE